jgi:hypothetical protein
MTPAATASPFGPVRKWPKLTPPKPLPAPRPATAHRDDTNTIVLPRHGRRPIAVGTIRHHNGRTTTLTSTPAGVTGRITPALIRATTEMAYIERDRQFANTDDLMAGGAA